MLGAPLKEKTHVGSDLLRGIRFWGCLERKPTGKQPFCGFPE